MLEKNCKLCGNSFLINKDENLSLNRKIRDDFRKFELMEGFDEEIFCYSCITEISEIDSFGKNEAEINTKQGIMRIFIKKKKDQTILEIKNKKFRYSLISDKFNSKNEAELQFFEYILKLKNNRFKIIRNIEALDENYRRVFSRIKYGMLFLD
tara:strand:- start:510 stop:968 length:459 start_codon:yes stop_codon:yes gene_type:complete